MWALFVHPVHEGKGIGKKLQQMMLDWYFTQTNTTLWLDTAPNTRAEKFYLSTGWEPAGGVNKGEVKFEMSHEAWMNIKVRPSFRGIYSTAFSSYYYPSLQDNKAPFLPYIIVHSALDPGVSCTETVICF